MDDKHVTNPSNVPSAAWCGLRVLMFKPPLRELLGDACVVEEPRFPEADVNVFVEVRRLDSGWVGAKATPAIPDLVKLGTDIGGVSMMAGKFFPAALMAAAKRSLASDGIVDTSPMRAGSTEGFVRLP